MEFSFWIRIYTQNAEGDVLEATDFDCFGTTFSALMPKWPQIPPLGAPLAPRALILETFGPPWTPKWSPSGPQTPPLRDKMTTQALNVETLDPPLNAKQSPSGPITRSSFPGAPHGPITRSSDPWFHAPMNRIGIDGVMDSWMHRSMESWIDSWMHSLIVSWMDLWFNALLDGLVAPCLYIAID